MPSPKAVLRDIHDLKLDPKTHHREIARAGRLKHVATSVPAPALVVPRHVEEPKVPVVEADVKKPVKVDPPKSPPAKKDDEPMKTEVRPEPEKSEPKVEAKKDDKTPPVKAAVKKEEKDEKKAEEPAAS